jgi:hypothetical protein
VIFLKKNSKSGVLGPVLEQQSFICVEIIFFRLKNEKKESSNGENIS